jgi:hypothetical protein
MMMTGGDEALGRACYEGFFACVREWMPTVESDWDALSEHVQRGWIAGAKAAIEQFAIGNSPTANG